MYLSVARTFAVGLMMLGLAGCQSGASWPWAKKDPAVSQPYPTGATPPASYSSQAATGTQLPTATNQPYNVGNSYAPPTTTSSTGGGLYPEAAASAAAATYPGTNTAAGTAYGASSTYAGANGAYPSTGYASPASNVAAPQEGMYGSSAAPAAPTGYVQGSPYATTAPASSYGTPAGSYAPPSATGAYPQTASTYPSTGDAGAYSQTPPQSYAPPATTPANDAAYGAGSPVAQTADSRYSRYDTSAAATSGGYATPAANSYPAATAPAAAGATAPYQGSAYPATPAASTPSASTPYRPGGTSDYVPTSPGGSVPSGYGATGSGVRPAGFEESPATAGGSLSVVSPDAAAAAGTH